jgi:hypothetical protein
MAVLQDGAAIDEFESDKPAEHWQFKDSKATTLREGIKQGTGALSWETPDKGSIATSAIPKSWKEFSKLAFWARCAEERVVDVIVAPEKGPARFWRKIVIPAGDWHRVEIALYQFRSDDVPTWSDVARLEISAREGSATIHLDDLRLLRKKEGEIPQVEPDEAVIARAFGPEPKEVLTKKTANFRLYTNAPLDVEKVGKALEEFYQLFRKTFALGEANLDYPATLVIHKTRPDYVRFASRTALEVYAGVTDEKNIRSDGYTFENYSTSFYLEKFGDRRPVFYHEVCHQLVTRCLKLKGPRGASWAEEGLCYFMQNEFIKQDGLHDQVQSMISNPRRTALDKFTVSLSPTGVINLQSMMIVAYAVKGSPKESAPAFLSALRDGVRLQKAVEEGLKLSMADFEKGWEEFCKEAYR